ncbi:Scr1 family TA system antitoxin-like transcriptional regulator, partial [Plantactinospora solaniradicis]
VIGMINGRLRRQEEFANSKAILDIRLEPQVIDRRSAPVDVWHQQLMHLYEVATTHPRVSIQILRSKAVYGTGYLPQNPFTILTYRRPSGLSLVDADSNDAGRLITDPVLVRRYETLFDQMTSEALAMDKATSARLIYEAAESCQ